MTITRHRAIAAGVAALAVAAGGTGVAYATGTIGSSQTPQERQTAILKDLADRLGVSVDKLRAAIKAVAGDQIDQALADGKLTKEQADQLKQRLESSTLLPFGIGPGPGPGFGHHGFGPGRGILGAGLDVAASYLGMTEAELRTQLQSGKSLADVAKAKGKSVDGLENALLGAVSKKLDEAVTAGTLTADEKAQILAKVKAGIDAMVNGTMPKLGPRFGGGGMGMHEHGSAQMRGGMWG